MANMVIGKYMVGLAYHNSELREMFNDSSNLWYVVKKYNKHAENYRFYNFIWDIDKFLILRIPKRLG